MVSGQWEVSRRHGVEVGEALPEEEGLARTPLSPCPPPSCWHAGSCWRWGSPPLPSSPEHRQKPHTKHGWRKQRRSLGPKGHPNSTLPALDTQFATWQKNTGLHWLICHKLSFWVHEAKYCPNCNKTGNLKLSVNLSIENVACSISRLFYCNY